MNILDYFREILIHDNRIDVLRNAVISLREMGTRKDDIIETLEQLREEMNETQADIILDVLDFLTGWCSPNMTID